MANEGPALDYETTFGYFKELHETRFRLLAIVPAAAGAAVVGLPAEMSGRQQIAVGLLGLLVTAGLALYDQRNSMIYDRLVRRGKLLEVMMSFPPLQLECEPQKPRAHGGPFFDRPPRRCLWRWKSEDRANDPWWKIDIPWIWHDLGLSIVYGAAFGAWAFIVAEGLFRAEQRYGNWQLIAEHPLRVGVVVNGVAVIVLIVLAAVNDSENEKVEAWIKEEAKRLMTNKGSTDKSADANESGDASG